MKFPPVRVHRAAREPKTQKHCAKRPSGIRCRCRGTHPIIAPSHRSANGGRRTSSVRGTQHTTHSDCSSSLSCRLQIPEVRARSQRVRAQSQWARRRGSHQSQSQSVCTCETTLDAVRNLRICIGITHESNTPCLPDPSTQPNFSTQSAHPVHTTNDGIGFERETGTGAAIGVRGL